MPAGSSAGGRGDIYVVAVRSHPGVLKELLKASSAEKLAAEAIVFRSSG
jgi:hypothetical protein